MTTHTQYLSKIKQSGIEMVDYTEKWSSCGGCFNNIVFTNPQGIPVIMKHSLTKLTMYCKSEEGNNAQECVCDVCKCLRDCICAPLTEEGYQCKRNPKSRMLWIKTVMCEKCTTSQFESLMGGGCYQTLKVFNGEEDVTSVYDTRQYDDVTKRSKSRTKCLDERTKDVENLRVFFISSPTNSDIREIFKKYLPEEVFFH